MVSMSEQLDDEEPRRKPSIWRSEPQPWPPIPTPLTSQPTRVFAVDYPAGSEKTRSACPYAVRRAAEHGERFLIAFPTKKLMEEAYRKQMEPLMVQYNILVQPVESHERDAFGNIRRKAQTNSWAVARATREIETLMGIAVKKNFQGKPVSVAKPNIIMCTHRALRLLRPHEKLKEWHVILDEVFDPVEACIIRLCFDNLNLVWDRFQTYSGVLTDYYHLKADPRLKIHELRRVIENKLNDQVYNIIGPLAEAAMSGGSVFISATSWNKAAATAIARMNEPEKGEDVGDPLPKTRLGELHFSAVFGQELAGRFQSFTIMSAALKDTLLYRLWSSRFEVEWVPHPEIRGKFERHDLQGRKVDIGYLCEHMLTKNARDNWAEDHGGKRLIDEVIKVAEGFFDLADLQSLDESGISEEKQRKVAYVYVVNNDTDDEAIRPKGQAVRIPNVSHGRNDWRWVNQALFFSALNPSTPAAHFLRSVSMMTDLQILTARTYTTAYQSMMRVAVRNDEALRDAAKAGEVIRLLVPDRGCAEWLATWFTNCQGGAPAVVRVGDLEWDPPGKAGRPPLGERAMTNAEKQRAYRKRQKLALLEGRP